jgi:serine phosphatase RsbU (regulator of sigma subunit)
VSGLDLLQQVHQELPSVPVIVISGAGVMVDVVKALRLGAVDYLTKPIIDLEVLVLSIHKSLERSQLLVDNQRYRLQVEQANKKLHNHIALLEQDQLAGHFVQQSMLPATPFYMADYVCEHKLIPSLFLSGDCIDYVLIKERYFTFYLADVSGHGSAPAFVTIWLKNIVAQLVRLKQIPLDKEKDALLALLSVVNSELIEMGINNHLTIFVGVLDTQTNQFYYVVAGHLPLPVLLEQDKAQFLSGSGKPLGLFDNAQWQVNQVKLSHQTFTLLLFSDGILELLDDELIEQEKALLTFVEETDGNVDEMVKQLNIENIKDLPDDVAMFSIKKVIEVC